MSPHCPLAVFAAALLTAPSAQDVPPPFAPDEAEVRYLDGSVIRATFLQDAVEVQTRYGKLTVPTREIRQIEFGVHLAPLVEKRVEAAVRNLGSTSYREREAAVQELVALGPHAYPALCRAAKSPDLEVAQRVEIALKRIRARVPAKQLRVCEDDVIHTPGFTIVGRILHPALQARAENFGDLSLKVSQLRVIRLMGACRDVEVTVDAARHVGSAGGGGHWLDTGFEVRSNTRLVVTAVGQVDLWPQGAGQYVCGPQGYSATGRAPGQFPGALLGRVGENGPVFVVGERYQGSPGREGRLYLQVGPNPWNNPSSGSFQVRVALNRDLDVTGD